MRETIFRLNDIRGEIDRDMTVHDMAYVAQALIDYIKKYDPTITTIGIGRDGRLHSSHIYTVMHCRFRDAGFQVINLGICPTPVVQFIMHTASLQLALMITASHNGPTYNGCKIFYRNQPLCGTALQELRIMATQRKTQDPVCHEATDIQHNGPTISSVDHYITWIEQNFFHLKGWNARFVFDCGSGAAGAILPALIKRMEWPNAHVLYAEIDGHFPFHEADPIVYNNMRDLANTVQKIDAICGVGFDGDGDRMGVISSSGHHIRGDQLLALFAQNILRKSPHQTIVFDNKCSQMLQDVILKEQGTPIRSPSGHALIRQNMINHNAVFGGELSCHFFFADSYFGYDDGIYAALRLLTILQQTTHSLDDLLNYLPATYSTEEWRISYKDQEKWNFIAAMHDVALRHHAISEISTLDGIRLMTPHGWLLLRASQTQPAVCLRSEAYSPQDIQPLGLIIKNLLETSALWSDLEPAFDAWLETARGNIYLAKGKT